MMLAFTKMHGAGNDFVVIDGVSRPVTLTPDQLRWLADRRFGVGADQILLVEPPPSPDLDFRYRIFNADGNEVEQCGNGARCFVRFVRDQGLTQKTSIRVLTRGGVIQPTLLDNGEVLVHMGPARLKATDVHLDTTRLAVSHEEQATLYHFSGSAGTGQPDVELIAQVVSMGNPHAVCLVDQVDTAPVDTIGPWLERHPRFTQGVNVGFLQIVDRHHAKLRVWERGVGETLACGTGACAAAVSGILRGQLDSPVTLTVPGGSLRIDWDGPTNPDADVCLSGPAVTVFQGQIQLP